VKGIPQRNSKQVETIDAHGGVIIPGLIDPFWVLPHMPGWLIGKADPMLCGLDLAEWTRRLLQRALRSGVTSVELKCAHDSGLEGLAVVGYLTQQQQPRIIGSLMASLPEEGKQRNQLVSSLIGEVIPEVRQRRMATFCDVGWGSHSGSLTEANAVLRAALGAGLRPKLHVESTTPVEDVAALAISLGAAAVGCTSPLAIHLATSLANSHVLPVYLPGIREENEPKRINVQPLLSQGLPIALGSGTGWDGCQSRSMWSVLASAIDRMGMTLAEAITACSLNNARALEIAHETGSIEEGKRADLVLLDLHDYREIEAAPDNPPVSLVMVNGAIAHLS
jgi:imidazolonepropionase